MWGFRLLGFGRLGLYRGLYKNMWVSWNNGNYQFRVLGFSVEGFRVWGLGA